MAEKVELKVTGMSCGHCEVAVIKALMALDGVKKAEADHKGAQRPWPRLKRDKSAARP